MKRKPFHIYHQTHENKVTGKADPIPTETPSEKELIVHIVERGTMLQDAGAGVDRFADANATAHSIWG